MGLSADTKKRLIVATTSQEAGEEIANRIDSEPVTLSAITLYCSPTGSDTNPGTSTQPLRQIAKALSLVPKRIRHLVRINVAAGNYDGFEVSSFIVESSSDGTPSGLHILGTFAAPTLAQGITSGTLTAATAAVIATGTWTQWADTLGNWAANALRGMFIEITSGTGVGTVIPILSNTDTVLDVAASSVTGGIGSAYRILDCASIIVNPIQVPGSIPAYAATNQSPTPTPVGINVTGCVGNSRTGQIRIEGLKVAFTTPTTSHTPLMITGSGPIVNIARCQSVNATLLTHIQISGACQVNLSSVVVESLGAAATCVNVSGATSNQNAQVTISSSLLRTGNGTVYSGYTLNMSNTQIDGGIGLSFPSACSAILSGLIKATSGTSQAIRARASSNNIGGTMIHLISSGGFWATARSAGVELNGPHVVRLDGTFTLSASTAGFILAGGARCIVSAASSVTTTTSEILLDSGAAQTLADMRAASPKLLSNAYFTIIHE